MRRVSESFAAKLLVGLIGTVGLLLLVVFAAVRLETGRQERRVAAAAVEGALSQFEFREEIQRLQTDRLAASLVDAPRAFALVQEGAFSELVGEAVYEMDKAGLLGVLVLSFTDPQGEVGLTILSDGSTVEGDPLEIGGLTADLLAGTDFETAGYRAMGDRAYNVRIRVLETRAGVLIGAVAFGLPVLDEDVADIGLGAGAEACLVLEGRCLAGTPRARREIGAALVAASTADREIRAAAADTDWSIHTVPLEGALPELGAWVIAVPLDDVRAPFDRITSSLLYGGGGALALALVLGLLVSRGLTRPVRDLVQATREVARGNYETEVRVSTRDEIGTLAGAFNEMTRGLLLKERYRSVLNKVVSEDVAAELMSGDLELGGENRRVTVLFADIRGFTSLTEGMEPQEVIGLLNECMERLSDAVEAEGGIVDKYVGDELMAVFGAPVSSGEDALRAVRAAVRMREAISSLNREREARGDAPIALGVGLSTGLAVAGNMGSTNRMNYTVLGEIVNLGARLCSGAAAGEILMGEETRREAGDGVSASSRGHRDFKGFSKPIEVFAVESVATETSARRAVPAGPALLALALAAVMATPAVAQELPTLRDAGVGYLSADGRIQVDLTGQLDLELLSFTGHDAGLAYGKGTWLAPRLRLFTDLFVGDGFYGLLEVRADRGSAPTEGVEDLRLEQALIRLRPGNGRVELQLGRFASPFGSYAARHLTELDPFVRPPLAYDYRTVISRVVAPGSASGFLTWKDRPEFRHSGAPPIWNVPYQWGAMLSGRVLGFDLRVAAMNSAPSSEVEVWSEIDRLEHPSLVVGANRSVTAELSVGLSYNRGPYADAGLGGSYGAYDQEIVQAEVTYARGPLIARAEWLRDRWEVPNVVDDAVEHGYGVEAQLDVTAGLFLAGRYGALDFGSVNDELGAASSRSDGRADWDHDIARYEVGFGYRLARNAGVLGTFMHNRTTGSDPDDDLWALRLWWRF